MGQIIQNIGQIVVLLLLLSFSAFFSGSETAFFNLSPRYISSLRKSTNRLQQITAGVLENPTMLLSCLLLGNMIVNILYFAISSTLVLRVSQNAGAEWAAAAAFITFTALLLFGEIFPKSVAYANSRLISSLFAAPAYLFLRIFGPIVTVLRFTILEPTLMMLIGQAKKPKQISTEDFKLLINKISGRGLISSTENKLIGEVIELGYLRVRHVMRPRVDMPLCVLTDTNENMRIFMRQTCQTKVPVYLQSIDNIVGVVSLRQLLLNPQSPPEKLVLKVDFVPEQKTVESLLEFFRRRHSDMAIVVDEYGQIAGSVCLEDIAEELLGPLEPTDGIVPIETVGPFEYRLAGNLAIHDWVSNFNIELTETRISTIGGLVTTMLGRIPKVGDVVHIKNLKFTVEKVRKHRVETLILSLETVKNHEN